MPEVLPIVGIISLTEPIETIESVNVHFDASRGLFKVKFLDSDLESSTYAGMSKQIHDLAALLSRPRQWRQFYAVWVIEEDRIEVRSLLLSPDKKRISMITPSDDLEILPEEQGEPEQILSLDSERFHNGLCLNDAVLLLATPTVRATLQKFIVDVRETKEAISGMQRRLREAIHPLITRMGSEDSVIGSEDLVLEFLITADSETQTFSQALSTLKTLVIRAYMFDKSYDPPKGFQIATADDVASIRSLLIQIGVDPYEGINLGESTAEEDAIAAEAYKRWGL